MEYETIYIICDANRVCEFVCVCVGVLYRTRTRTCVRVSARARVHTYVFSCPLSLHIDRKTNIASLLNSILN